MENAGGFTLIALNKPFVSFTLLFLYIRGHFSFKVLDCAQLLVSLKCKRETSCVCVAVVMSSHINMTQLQGF